LLGQSPSPPNADRRDRSRDVVDQGGAARVMIPGIEQGAQGWARQVVGRAVGSWSPLMERGGRLFGRWAERVAVIQFKRRAAFLVSAGKAPLKTRRALSASNVSPFSDGQGRRRTFRVMVPRRRSGRVKLGEFLLHRAP